MRLPQQLEASPLFQFADVAELLLALGERVSLEEADQIKRLSSSGLPPVTSREALAVMIGVNSGLIWSFVNRTSKHYRFFEIPKGKGVRQISAPRVALKIVQKWLSVHLANSYRAPPHVFGFVPGRSHILAAMVHIGADWSYSVDIENFFGTTPERAVFDAYQSLGYDEQGAILCAKICCLGGFLAQGAPTSPMLSNICFKAFDDVLVELSNKYDCRVTRYADDIVFSGYGMFPPGIREEIRERISSTPWRLAAAKESIQPIKGRIKIHGLLIKKNEVRLTKGYRNKVRAYSHILARHGQAAEGASRLRGHTDYARQVAKITGSKLVFAESVGRILDSQGSVNPTRSDSSIGVRPLRKTLLNRLLGFFTG